MRNLLITMFVLGSGVGFLTGCAGDGESITYMIDGMRCDLQEDGTFICSEEMPAEQVDEQSVVDETPEPADRPVDEEIIEVDEEDPPCAKAVISVTANYTMPNGDQHGVGAATGTGFAYDPERKLALSTKNSKPGSGKLLEVEWVVKRPSEFHYIIDEPSWTLTMLECGFYTFQLRVRDENGWSCNTATWTANMMCPDEDEDEPELEPVILPPVAVITAGYKVGGEDQLEYKKFHDGHVFKPGKYLFEFSGADSVTDEKLDTYFWVIHHPGGTYGIAEEGGYPNTSFTDWFSECGEYQIRLDVAKGQNWSLETTLLNFAILCE